MAWRLRPRAAEAAPLGEVEAGVGMKTAGWKPALRVAIATANSERPAAERSARFCVSITACDGAIAGRRCDTRDSAVRPPLECEPRE